MLLDGVVFSVVVVVVVLVLDVSDEDDVGNSFALCYDDGRGPPRCPAAPM